MIFLYIITRALFIFLGYCLIFPFWLVWLAVKAFINFLRWCFK